MLTINYLDNYLDLHVFPPLALHVFPRLARLDVFPRLITVKVFVSTSDWFTASCCDWLDVIP